MQVLRAAQDQRRFLAAEDRTQSEPGCGGTKEAGIHGLALHYRLGMPAEAEGTSADIGRVGIYAEPYLLGGPESETLRDSRGWRAHGGRTRELTGLQEGLNVFPKYHWRQKLFAKNEKAYQ